MIAVGQMFNRSKPGFVRKWPMTDCYFWHCVHIYTVEPQLSEPLGTRGGP